MRIARPGLLGAKMADTKAILESARTWHKLCLVVSGTALLLLLAPKNVDYQSALEEAYTLRDLDFQRYESFARGFLPINTYLPGGYGDYALNIATFLTSKLDFHVQPIESTRWDVKLIVQYDQAPTNGSLQEWHAWLTSGRKPTYFVPDWDTARLSMSRSGNGLASAPTAQYFTIRSSSWHRFPGEYTFRAFIDASPATSRTTDGGLPVTASQWRNSQWWSALDVLDSRDLWEKARILGSDHFVVEGDLSSHLAAATDNPSISGPNDKTTVRDWLIQAGLWTKLSTAGKSGEVVLPALRVYWSDLHQRPLQDAIAFMEEKQREIQDIDLLGLRVPGQLCIEAIPFAYLVIFLFLLLDVRYLRRVQIAEGLGDLSVAPWVVLYDDVGARLITAVSVVLGPSLLAIGLLVRYFSRTDIFATVLAVASILGAAVAEAGILRVVSQLKKPTPSTSPMSSSSA